MNRLFVQIYASLLAVVGAGVAVVVLFAVLAWSGAGAPVPRHLSATLRHVLGSLPAADAPVAEQAEAVRHLSDEIQLDLELFAADGTPIQVDRAWDVAPAPRTDAEWIHRPFPGLAVRLADGRVAVGVRGDRVPLIRFLAAVGFMGLVAGVAAWPISRRLTARLEALRAGVEAFGAGDLARRVPETGPSEVRALARAFNHSADRLVALLAAQRRLLASASHEFRSPLARIRMALELVGDEAPWARAAVRDVEELDGLVGDLLLAGRAGAGAIARVPVDLGVLAAEEAARVGATAEGAAVVDGDPAALRRLLRNLLENAARHGRPPLRVAVADGPEVTLAVTDAGAGVAEADRERVFEPFFRPAGHAEGRDGGVGLGLALVREIAAAHGGSARCESHGPGTAFVVRLPR